MTVLELNKLLEQTTSNIEAAFEAGQLDESEYVTFMEQANSDYADALNTLTEQTLPMDEALFSNGFGAALLELIDTEYEDANDALADIYEATGVEADDVLDLIEGEAVPTPELAETLAAMFEQTYANPEIADEFLGLAEEAVEDAYGEEDEEVEGEDEELYYEDEDEDEEIGYSYASQAPDMAEFAYTDARVAELENTLAEFQLANAVKDELAALERKAEEGLQNGWLPPVAYEALLGNFNREDDRVAAFSAACGQNQIDPATQLFGINYALEVFERCGPMMQFGAYVEEDIDPREVEAANMIEDTAVLNFQLWKQNKF